MKTDSCAVMSWPAYAGENSVETLSAGADDRLGRVLPIRHGGRTEFMVLCPPHDGPDAKRSLLMPFWDAFTVGYLQLKMQSMISGQPAKLVPKPAARDGKREKGGPWPDDLPAHSWN